MTLIGGSIAAFPQEAPPVAPLPPLPPAAPVIAAEPFDFEYEFGPEPPLPPEAPLTHLNAMLGKLAGKSFSFYAQAPQPGPKPPEPPFHRDMNRDADRARRERERADHSYGRGSHYLDRRAWQQAVESFDNVIEGKGSKADGAHYWKAYALSKLGRRDEALATVAQLEKEFPKSRWLNDAKALALEVRQSSGQAVSPENQADEDLKLIAINSLMASDPERAVPLLEKVLNGNNPPKVKERALFVLAQNRSAQSRDILARFAKGQGNPDLQFKAVEYLGIHGGADSMQLLSEIYGSTQDHEVKQRILRGYMIGRDRERLLAAAKSDSDPNLRRKAIEYLGASGAQKELADLYASESSPDVRATLLNSMMVANQWDRIVQAARTEKDARLRRRAIQLLGTGGKSAGTAEALLEIYQSEPDKEVRGEVLNALFIQRNAKAIIDLARKEKDPELKREAVQRLSHMKSKEATDFMMELLNK